MENNQLVTICSECKREFDIEVEDVTTIYCPYCGYYKGGEFLEAFEKVSLEMEAESKQASFNLVFISIFLVITAIVMCFSSTFSFQMLFQNLVIIYSLICIGYLMQLIIQNLLSHICDIPYMIKDIQEDYYCSLKKRGAKR